jgi:hypothetical protein
MDPVLPSLATIPHPLNRPFQLHATYLLYVRTFDEFCEQIDLITRRIARHELN